MRTTKYHCRFLKGPRVSTRRMWSCWRDPGTWNWGRHSFVWNLAQTCSVTLDGLVYGLLPFHPNQQAHGCISQAIKNTSALFFLCVWHLTIYFEYYIFGKAFKIENDGFGGFWLCPEQTRSIIWNIFTLCRNDNQGLLPWFFSVLERFIFLFLGNYVLISVFHRQ